MEDYLLDKEEESGLSTNSDKGALLMKRALEKYAEGDYEGGDKDREKANKYFDLAKLEYESESGKITALYGENRNFGIVFKVLETNFVDSIQNINIDKLPLIEAFKKVKKNRKLNEQFKVYNAFTNPQNVINAEEYVNEVIGLCSVCNQKEINSVNENLINFIQKKKINELIDINEDELELFESINYVITNKKTYKNINEYIKHKNVIVEYINNNNVINEEKSNIDDKLNECVISLEEKYDLILNDDEKDFIKEYSTKKSKSKCFNDNKKELISLLEKHIKQSDNTTKEQWIELKNKINESLFNEKTFMVDLAKIIEIKNKLS